MSRTLVLSASLMFCAIVVAAPAHAGDPRLIPDDRRIPTVEERYEPQAFPASHFADLKKVIPLLAGPAGEIGSVALPGNQSETSVAVSGLNVVVGYNDSRGFGLGIMFSADGGSTFADAGLLPLPAGYSSSGDPAVAVWNPPTGPAVFYAASIVYHPSGDISFALHRSTNGGMTWVGPFIVTTSVVPSTDFPDRESICVDPETGRVHIAWTNFSATVTMKATYSDDAATATPPTWNGPTVVGGRPQDGQATTLVANPFNAELYLAWQTYPGYPMRDIAFVKSADNGLTWPAPTDIGPQFFTHLCPWGFDRWLWSFSGSGLAFNPVDGGLEMVYAASVNGTPAGDFGDVYYRRSTNGGATWSAPQPLNVWPGSHRPQANPCVSVAWNGRIDVFWYDLSAGTGLDDYTDAYYCFSTDFGATWSSPTPTTPQPFHNEAGNDFGAPHQGDYNDADAYALLTAESHAAIAVMDDPGATGTGANGFSFRAMGVQVAPLRLRPNTLRVDDLGCRDNRLTAGESADLHLPLENVGRVGLVAIAATLSSLHPQVTIIGSATRSYANAAAGTSVDAASPFRVLLGPAYPCGEPARFRLDIGASGVASTYVEFSVPTGIPTATNLLSETFDGVVAPALPPGWSVVTLVGTPAPWRTTTTTPVSGPNAAFCPDPATPNFERLQGPALAIPAGTGYVEVSFDFKRQLLQYDDRYGYDTVAFDYQLDGVGGSHHSVGDAISFEPRYTHNVARASGDGSGDRSGWSGTRGYEHAVIRIAGLAGHSMTPRFQLTSAGLPGGGGAWVDNVRIDAVTLPCVPCAPTAVPIGLGGGSRLSLELEGPNPFQLGTSIAYALPEAAMIRIELIDVRGRIARTLFDGWREAGSHVLALSAREGNGDRLRPGVYFLRMSDGRQSRTLRLVALE